MLLQVDVGCRVRLLRTRSVCSRRPEPGTQVVAPRADRLVSRCRGTRLSGIHDHGRAGDTVISGTESWEPPHSKSGHDLVAEPFFVQLRQSSEDGSRYEEMSLLAEIWHPQVRVDNSRSLLIDALRGVLEQSRSAAGDDRKLFEERFHFHRSNFSETLPRPGERNSTHGLEDSIFDAGEANVKPAAK